MANLTVERLKEMEDEMDRFEMEIESTKAAEAAAAAAAAERSSSSKMIIGAGTYNQIDLQAKMGRGSNRSNAEHGPIFPATHHQSAASTKGSSSDDTRAPQIGPMYNLRPPPPPPSIPPMFTPHQLSNRPTPPSRPSFMRPGMLGPPRLPPGMMPPPPPPPQLSNSYMPGGLGPMMSSPLAPGGRPIYDNSYPPPMIMPPPPYSSSTSSSSIERSKVVYSAPPVKNVPVDNNKNKKSSTMATTTATTTTATTTTAATTSITQQQHQGGRKNVAASNQMSTSSSATVVANIELNVPVHEVIGRPLTATTTPGGTRAEVGGSMGGGDGGGAGEGGSGMGGGGGSKKEKRDKKKKFVRMAAGTVWEDLTLNEWDPDDFRVFCGDLGNEVTDDTLARAFNKYPSFRKARVIRDKRSMKTKGFGFVSFKDPNDFVRAIREMNGKYVGNRPIKLRKSCWQDRQIDNVRKKDKEKKKLGFK